MACPTCLSGQIILLDRWELTPPEDIANLITIELGKLIEVEHTDVQARKVQITEETLQEE